MGIGTPHGSEGYVAEDVLHWQGQAPQAPRELQPYADYNSLPPPVPPLNPTPVQHILPAPFAYNNVAVQQNQSYDFNPVTQSMQDMSMQPREPPATPLPRDKLMEDYYAYQFPSAICQNCGLFGCNCRSCPPTMQSFDGSWAKCCSRKHVRTAELAQRGIGLSSVALEHQDMRALSLAVDPMLAGDGNNYNLAGLKPGGDQPFSPDFTMNDFGIPGAVPAMDFNDLVMTDPELPSKGCCCGGET